MRLVSLVILSLLISCSPQENSTFSKYNIKFSIPSGYYVVEQRYQEAKKIIDENTYNLVPNSCDYSCYLGGEATHKTVFTVFFNNTNSAPCLENDTKNISDQFPTGENLSFCSQDFENFGTTLVMARKQLAKNHVDFFMMMPAHKLSEADRKTFLQLVNSAEAI